MISNCKKEIAEKESSIEKMEGMLDNPHLPTESRNQIIENITERTWKIHCHKLLHRLPEMVL